MDYYKKNAKEYIELTKDVDMSETRDWFLSHLPTSTKTMLDLGFGSARDSLVFVKNYDMYLIDPEEEFVKHALELGFKHVYPGDALSVDLPCKVDAIWANACLLHIPMKDLPRNFEKLASMLNDDGIMFCSFKYGNGELTRGERFYSDLDEDSLAKILEGTGLKISDIKITGDRLGRDQIWLNAILIKTA